MKKSKRIGILLLAVLLLAGTFAGYQMGWFGWYPGTNDAPVITLKISEKNYKKIQKIREIALEKGILLSEDNEYVKAGVLIDGKESKAEIRLKGDWTDHLKHDVKWSFRVKMKKEGLFLGMKKFSLQHPVVRNYMYEWVFHKLQQELGMITPRYGFVNVKLNVDGEESDLGVYAYEEAFHKLMIENNQRREGVIVKFDESDVWKDRFEASTDGTKRRRDFAQMFKEARVLPFSESKTFENETLNSQFSTVRHSLDRYRSGEIPANKIFDMEALGKQLAMVNLVGGEHSVIWHNLRFYYNPVTGLLEPIVFDTDGGNPINYLSHYHVIGGDSALQYYHAKYLDSITSNGFMDRFFEKIENELESNLSIVNSEFPDEKIDRNVYTNNSVFIRRVLENQRMLRADLVQNEGDELEFMIENLFSFDLEVLGLYLKDSLLYEVQTPRVITPLNSVKAEFLLNSERLSSYNNMREGKGKSAFDPVKDQGKLKVRYKIFGSDVVKEEVISQFRPLDESFFGKNDFSTPSDLSKFKFLYKNDSSKTISFISGIWELAQPLVLPAGYKVIVPQKFSLDMTKKARIISFSPIEMRGTEAFPIYFLSSDQTGQGIAVIKAWSKSVWNNVKIKGLSHPATESWALTGGVTFYESEAELSNVHFDQMNRCEDALNIVRSPFVLDRCNFDGTFSDAFDGDFVNGEIKNCRFSNLGNDAIDVSGSRLVVRDVFIEKASDKAISIGENSTMEGLRVEIRNCEIGLTAKDLSTVTLDSLTLINCKLGFTAFQKKPEFGAARIMVTSAKLDSIGTRSLIEQNSETTINGTPEPTSTGVMDKLYGKEFGKQSVR